MGVIVCPLCGAKVNAATAHCPECGCDPHLSAEEARLELEAREGKSASASET